MANVDNHFLTTKSISVVLAAYNEIDNLEPVLQRTLRVLKQLTPAYEVIIVDDGSTDGTGQLTDDLAARCERVSVVHHGQNRGFGASLITGYANSSRDWIAPLPADGQIPPEELKKFVSLMTDADMVIGVPAQRSYNAYRKALHFGVNMLTRVLVDRNPPPSADCCMFRREVFQNVRLVGRSGFANSEFSIKAARQGYRLATVKVETASRLSGSSKVTNLRTMFATVWDMIRSHQGSRV